MKATNRSQLRLFVLVAVAVAAAAIAYTVRGAERASPPHLIRIAGEPAHVRLPGGDRIQLPVGSVFAADGMTYHAASRVTDVRATAELFNDGFGD